MDGEPGAGDSEQGAPRQILIVDDDAVTQVIFSHVIARLGFVSRGVESAREALEELHRTHYDLIILDAHLPDMHGAEVASAVRRSRYPSTPIIAVSSDDSDENVRLLEIAGADEFIAKPVTADQLRELLDRWMRLRPRRRGAAE
jgi:CheY-like chemotaxis protein